MRLRLAHTLSLLLVTLVAAALLACAGLLGWNLRRGFNEYLQARDVEGLEPFVTVVEAALAPYDDVEALTDGRVDLRDLVEGYALRRGLRPAGPRPPPFPPDRPPPPEDGLGARIAVYRPDGSVVAGAPGMDRVSPGIERALVVHGRTLGSLRLRAAPALPDAIEADFLGRQYRAIVLVAGGLVVAALVLARLLAARWVRRLLDVQQATARIARGEFGVRLAPGRADEIGELIGDVNAMAAGLERLDGARRRWIAEISHELRTPLTVLVGELDALADGVRPLTAAAVHSLREEAGKLAALIEDLHLLARADLDALPMQFARGDARALLEGARERFAAQAAARGLALRCLAPGEAADDLEGCWDLKRMEQVLSNLIANSLRYTDAPGRIELSAQATATGVALCIEDSAPGVAAADLGRLFEPLYRAQSARDRAHGGSGLGLSICAAIVRAHGGAIRAAASRLGGLAVTVELPRDASRAAP